MKWKTKSGKEVNINPSKYKIDWSEDGRSKPETAVRKFLYPFWRNHVVLSEFRFPKTLYRADLVNLNLGIFLEISPDEVHLQFNQFMHGSRAGYLKKIKSDYEKMEIAELNGFKFIELNNVHLKELTKEMFKREFDLDL